MKSQSGFEVLIMSSIVIIILVFSVVSYVTKNSEVGFTRSYLSAQKICHETKSIINQISADGFGTAVKFTVPNQLEGSDFNLTVNSTNRIVAVEWNKNQYSCPLITQNATNSTHYVFTIQKGDNIAKNSDGNVFIQKI